MLRSLVGSEMCIRDRGSRQEILSFAGLSAVHIYDEALKLRSYIAAGQSR